MSEYEEAMLNESKKQTEILSSIKTVGVVILVFLSLLVGVVIAK